MASLLNSSRPPVFCPGCSHDRIVRVLDQALDELNIKGEEVVLVSDIGCSGLFDVFFHTHAFHGLHGRALTYALGLKMARPELQVIVTMGDGGMGIGGAHLLSSCRRNADITLLVLNNFNFGMTGGQYSSTTPTAAQTSSRFLNQLEKPLDICRVAEAAGAPFVLRCSGLENELKDNMIKAISYKGFSVMDIWGICPGRFSRKNRLRPADIKEQLGSLKTYTGVIGENERDEYVGKYYALADLLSKPSPPLQVSREYTPPKRRKSEILLLGSAGQRVVTAGELLCLAGMSGGMQATQKNDYDITVLRGPSVSEIILWPDEVGYTGIESPDVIVVLSEDGVNRRKKSFSELTEDSLVIHAHDVAIPGCRALKIAVDFKAKGIRREDFALAALAILAQREIAITLDMLQAVLVKRFSAGHLAAAEETIKAALQD